MSEKIYGWLLRLYPSRFRETYGEEALQFFRDRARGERGFVPRLRLWFDLLADFALSMPREYFRVQPELVSYSAHLRSDGVPSFFVLAEEPPGSGALLFGSMLSMAALITFLALLNHGAKHVPLSALLRPTQGAADSRSSAFSPPPQPAATYNGEEGTISSAARRRPRMATNLSPQTNAMARNFQMDAPPLPESAEPVQQPWPGAASSLRSEVKLDATERHHAGHRRDFYRVSDGNADPAIIEKAYGQIETIAAPVLKRVNEQRSGPNVDELGTLVYFAAFQYGRVPAFRPNVLAMAESIHRSLLAQALESPESWAATLKKTGVDATDPAASYEKCANSSAQDSLSQSSANGISSRDSRRRKSSRARWLRDTGPASSARAEASSVPTTR